MAVIGCADLADAVKCTGEATVLPPAGEHTVTPMVPAVQPEGPGVGVGVGVVDGVGVGVGDGHPINHRGIGIGT